MDTPVEPTGVRELRSRTPNCRVSRLENEMREVKSILLQMLPMLARIRRPGQHLAAFGDEGRTSGIARRDPRRIGRKPSKTYLWGVVGVRWPLSLPHTAPGWRPSRCAPLNPVRPRQSRG